MCAFPLNRGDVNTERIDAGAARADSGVRLAGGIVEWLGELAKRAGNEERTIDKRWYQNLGAESSV